MHNPYTNEASTLREVSDFNKSKINATKANIAPTP